jgi:hypothetical protein
MSPEQRVMLSLLRDGKQPPAVIPEPRKAPSEWRIRMDKQEAWRELRSKRAKLADLKLPLYTRMSSYLPITHGVQSECEYGECQAVYIGGV